MNDDLVKQGRAVERDLNNGFPMTCERGVIIQQMADRIEELKDHLASMAGLWAKSDSEKQLLLGRIEELEALYEAAKHDAQEAEAYAEALEAKLYDIAQDELKGQSQ